MSTYPAARSPALDTTATPILWTPARVLVTKSAAGHPHGAAIVERCSAAGVRDVSVLTGNRLPAL
jgi:spore photoproduct lyase